MAKTGQVDTAVCVLGCRVGGRAFARRARAAAQAFKDEMSRAREPLSTIVLACGGTRWDGVVEADALADLLQQDGVPTEKIVKERASENTYENAVEAARILSDKHPPQVILVTCSWHLRRARVLFERAGLTVGRGIGVPPPSPSLLDRVWWYGRERVSMWRDLVR